MPRLRAAHFFDETGFDQRAQQVHCALAGNTQFGPDFVRGEVASVAQQVQELLLPGS